MRNDSGTAPPRHRSRYVSILVNVSAHTGSGSTATRLRNDSGVQQPSATHTQSFYFCRMPEHGTLIQHRADCAGKEIGYKIQNKTPVDFQNKILCVRSSTVVLYSSTVWINEWMPLSPRDYSRQYCAIMREFAEVNSEQRKKPKKAMNTDFRVKSLGLRNGFECSEWGDLKSGVSILVRDWVVFYIALSEACGYGIVCRGSKSGAKDLYFWSEKQERESAMEFW